MHMVYGILVVDMIVCDMQLWCGCVLFEVFLNFKNHVCNNMYGHNFCVYAMIFMDMDYLITWQKYRQQYIVLAWEI